MLKQVGPAGRTRAPSQLVPLKPEDLNPLRVLEPKTKRLSSLKAERVLRVLEENTRNIKIVLVLPEFINQLERFRVALGVEFTSLLEEHGALREKYEKSVELLLEGEKEEKEYQEWLLLQEKHESLLFEDISSNEKSNENIITENIHVPNQNLTTLNENLEKAKHNLCQSTKNILRNLRLNPTAMKTFLEHSDQTLKEANFGLIKELQTLHVVVKARLLTTPVELEERKYYIAKVVQRENKIFNLKEKLQVEYDCEIRVKLQEAEKKNVIIENLKSCLRHINDTATDEYAKILAEANKTISADLKTSEARQRATVESVMEIKKLASNKRSQNFSEEQEKRKRKFKLSTEVFNWIQKYDADMGQRQDEFDEITLDRDSLKKDLDDLGRHFIVIEKEYGEIMKTRKLAEEAEQKRLEELETKTAAVTTLQACWRGYRTRKILRNKNKKGKKGKKK